MARPGPGHLPRQEASHPTGGDGGSVERTFRADRRRPSFAGDANDTDLRPAFRPPGGPHRGLAGHPHPPPPPGRRAPPRRGPPSLTRWVLAHKRLVAVGWLVLTLAGFYGAAKV